MNRILIVDGYNVIHRVPEFQTHLQKSLQAARDALVRYCGVWRAKRSDLSALHVVFDGDSSVEGGGPRMIHGVQVTYSRTGEDADDRIRRIIDDLPARTEHTVVTDDRGLAEGVRARHGGIMSVADFYCTIQKPKDQGRKSRRDEGKASLSPEDERRITEDLRREWGLK